MKFEYLYKCLFWLYPSDFRIQFGPEMLGVLGQRASDRRVRKGTTAFRFFAVELTGLIKGAFIMWLDKVIPFNRKPIQLRTLEVPDASLTLPAAKKAREEALKQMVTAIENHDFVKARLCSEQEHRLKAFIENIEKAGAVERIRMA